MSWWSFFFGFVAGFLACLALLWVLLGDEERR